MRIRNRKTTSTQMQYSEGQEGTYCAREFSPVRCNHNEAPLIWHGAYRHGQKLKKTHKVEQLPLWNVPAKLFKWD